MKIIKKSDVKIIKKEKGKSPKNCKWTKEELEDLYAYDKQNLSPVQIGKLHNPQVDAVTIRRWLDIFNIEKKTLLAKDGESLSSKRYKSEISDKEYRKHVIEEKRENNITPKKCIWTKEELEDLYAYDKQNLTPRQIGKMHDLQVDHATIGRWIDIFGIDKKTLSEAISGKNNGQWQGGITDNKYCEEFNDNVKEQVRKYWFRKCVLCNITEDEEGQRMCIHHVDYNKNQGCDSTEWKLIPLCNYDNFVTVNNNRNYYEHLFTNFIMIRKTLEEFEWKIDYKSIGLIDEIEDDKI